MLPPNANPWWRLKHS